jgi:hypothetical protein
MGATIGGSQPCARSAVFSQAELQGLPDPGRRWPPRRGCACAARSRWAGGCRSARGRPWTHTTGSPGALDWSAGDERHITARYRIDTVQVEVQYALGAGGHVRSVVFDRWGDPRGGTGSWGLHPFGGEISSYATFDGLSIPSAGRFGWFFGTDRWSQGEFFRYQITELRLGSAQ